MNKAELLADLQSQSYCKQLVGDCVKPIGTENDIAHFSQAYLEVDDAGRVAQVKNCFFMVTSDGTAYYDVQSIPSASVEPAVQAKLTTVSAVAGKPVAL